MVYLSQRGISVLGEIAKKLTIIHEVNPEHFRYGKTICLRAVGNERNLKLWQDIRHDLEGQTEKHDQDILNDKLRARRIC